MQTAALWITLILSDTAGQLLLKRGAVQAAAAGWLPNAFIASGYAFYIVSFAVWMQLLKNTRLFIALSGSTAVYVAIVFGSYFLLGEQISVRVLLGSLSIASGVFLIGWGKGAVKNRPGSSAADGSKTVDREEL